MGVPRGGMGITMEKYLLILTNSPQILRNHSQILQNYPQLLANYSPVLTKLCKIASSMVADVDFYVHTLFIVQKTCLEPTFVNFPFSVPLQIYIFCKEGRCF